MTRPAPGSTPENVYLNTESILKTICGTAVTGKANSCDHDHSAQAVAIVAQIAGFTLRKLADDHPRDNITLDELAAYAAKAERGEG